MTGTVPIDHTTDSQNTGSPALFTNNFDLNSECSLEGGLTAMICRREKSVIIFTHINIPAINM